MGYQPGLTVKGTRDPDTSPGLPERFGDAGFFGMQTAAGCARATFTAKVLMAKVLND